MANYHLEEGIISTLRYVGSSGHWSRTKPTSEMGSKFGSAMKVWTYRVYGIESLPNISVGLLGSVKSPKSEIEIRVFKRNENMRKN